MVTPKITAAIPIPVAPNMRTRLCLPVARRGRAELCRKRTGPTPGRSPRTTPTPAGIQSVAERSIAERGLSRAFVKDQDEDQGADDIPDRVVSPHRNLVTATGLAHIDDELRRSREGLTAARGSADRAEIARHRRDLRYWTARRASAELVPAPTDVDKVRFGSTVTVATDRGEPRTYMIVGEDEASPAEGRISYVSPLAQALLGSAGRRRRAVWRRRVGDHPHRRLSRRSALRPPVAAAATPAGTRRDLRPRRGRMRRRSAPAKPVRGPRATPRRGPSRRRPARRR